MSVYISFIFNDHFANVQGTPTAYNSSPELKYYIIWISFFLCLCLLLPRVYQFFFPVAYAKMDKKKRQELPAYCSCFFHHFYVVGFGLYQIQLDFHRVNSGTNVVTNYEAITFVFPAIMGYLISDTVFYAIPELLQTGKSEYLLHHVVTLLVLVGLLSCPVEIMRYAPHFFIAETSAVFFALAWHLRAIGFKNVILVKSLESLFALSFFVTRVVNLPLATAALLKYHSHKLTWTKYLIILIVCLQFYWFYKILASLRKKNSTPKKMAQKKSE